MLENLHKSQNFVSAIDLAVSLRSFSILSCAIFLLWSLSPLGGQSSLLRLLYEANFTVTTSQAVYYPVPDAYSWLMMNEITETYVSQRSIVVLSNIAAVDTLHIYGNLNPSSYPTSYFNADSVRSRNWGAIPDEQVSQRLTEVLNTYWDVSRWVDTTTRTNQQNHRRAL